MATLKAASKSHDQGSIEQAWDEHQYKKLTSNDSIRILMLYPGPYSANLHGEFREVRLQHCTLQYEALSYVWGEHTFSEHIYFSLSRTKLHITSTLASALKRIRREDEPRALWVDAICIDQEDVAKKEKSHQVSLMHVIFGKAFEVLIWLGTGDDQCSIVIECYESFAGLAEDFGIKFNPDGWMQMLEEEIGGDREQLKGLVDQAREKRIATLVKMPWFSRLWIVQEAVLARRATFLWGRHELSWTNFGKALKLFTEATFATGSRDNDALAFHRAYKIVTLRAEFRLWSSPMVFLDQPYHFIMRNFESFMFQECFDDRDRIYALLAISRPQDNLLFQPDYSLSVHRTYKKFAQRVLLDQGIQLLEYAGLWRREQQIDSSLDPDYLPSWAPDFRLSRTITRVPSWPRNIHECTTATDFDPYIYQPPNTENMISIRGRIFDSFLLLIDSGVYDDLSAIKILREAVRGFKAVYDSLKLSEYMTGESLLKAFVRTLLGDVSDSKTESSIAAWDAYERQVLMEDGDIWTTIVSATNAGGSITAENLEKQNSDSATARQALDFHRQMLDAVGLQKLIITQGKYIGVVPGNTDALDFIAIFAGARTPYVVRWIKEAVAFQLVGPCYIHGLMTREGLDNPNINKLKKLILLI